MSTHKHIDLICVAVLVLTLLLTVLFLLGERLGIQVITDPEADPGTDWFTSGDLSGDWRSDSATVITLRGDSGHVSGKGAYAYGGDVVISNGGYYVISGELDDGSIIVDAYSSSKVWIRLDGAAVSCSDDACFQVLQADKVFLTLAEGSDNSFVSGERYSEEALNAGRDGAVFAGDNLTINGSGALSVTAGYKHGIEANDALVITGGTLTIDAARDAINVNDDLRICQAALTLNAGDDGISVKGARTEGSDGIEAGTGYLYLESGALDITAGDDGIHAAGDVTIAGGDLAIRAGDDAVHSDSAINLLGGSLLVSDCYEGLEAVYIDMYGGDVTIYAQDDGFNANGGPGDMMGPGGQPGGDSTSGDEDTWIHISGGSVLIVNDTADDADGLDSNGDIVISGGDVRISLRNSGSNNAIDYASERGGVAEISGGTVVACGSYNMAEGFESASAQCSILYNIAAGVEAGQTVSLEDADGDVLLTWDVPCGFSSVILSCPEMALGESYLVAVGDQAEQITLDEVSASFGDAESAMFDGSFNPGGMGPRRELDGENGPPERPDGENGPPEYPEGENGPPERPEGADFSEDADGFSPPNDVPAPPEDDGSQRVEPSSEDGAPASAQPDGEALSAAAQRQNVTTEAVPYTRETWVWFGASVLILLMGLLVGIIYRKQ